MAKIQRGEGREATRWEHWQTTDNIIPKEQHYSVDIREKEKKWICEGNTFDGSILSVFEEKTRDYIYLVENNRERDQR